ncbi:MAG: hypothetical protein WAU91_06530 [Desulfatitalea sp.]
MAAVLDFEKVSTIDGVKSFYLVKQDGAVLASQGDSADSVCACIVLSGLNGDAIRSLLGYSKFNYLIFTRQCQENVIVFPLSNCFLAVMKEANAPTPILIQKVNEFLQTIKSKPNTGQNL